MGAEGLAPVLCCLYPPVACAIILLPPRAVGKPGFALPLQPQSVIGREKGPFQDIKHSLGKSRSQPL